MRQHRTKARSCFSGTKDNWDELFRVGGNRRALTIACLLQGLQQLCGFVRPTFLPNTVGLTCKTIEFSDVTSPPLFSPFSASLAQH